MKLNQYITESEERILDLGPMIWQELKKKCSPFIKEFKKTGFAGKRWIWRGADKRVSSYPGFKEITPRGDRRPKDMPHELHLYFDQEFYNRFGWYARSEGVFTVSNRSTAASYGAPYLFFPTGHYGYIWSSEIEDLYSLVDQEGLDTYGYEDYSYMYNEWEREWEEVYGEGGAGFWEYEGEQMGGHGIDRYEAEEAAEDVFGEDPNFDPGLLTWIPDEDQNDWIYQKEQEYREEQERKMDDAVASYRDKDLKGAINSKHEIMFNCKTYFLVHESYAEFLKDMISRGTYQLRLPFPPFGETTPPKYWAYNKKGQMVYNG